MSTTELGVGLISVGWMGKLHSRSYDRVNYHYPELGLRPRLVIAADVLAEQRDFARDALGYAQATEDWRDVVAHPDVQAISITAPNYLHREIASAVAAAGKHFWIEKPVGRTTDDAAAVAAAADKAGVRTAVGFNYRHAPSVTHARDLIASGAIGRITHVRGRFLNDYAAEPGGVLSWRFQRDRAGLGVLGDLMTHAVDLLQYLLGPVTEVSALTSIVIPERPLPGDGPSTHFAVVEGGPTGPVENEDYAAGLLRFGDGPVGTVEASRVTVGPRCQIGFEIFGTDGSVAWNFERMNELEVCLGRTGPDHGYRTVLAGPEHGDYRRFQPGPAISMSYDDLKVVEAALFLRSVETGEQLAPGVADALAASHVVDTMARSAESGSWLKVPATVATGTPR
ncbi:Gfo/Idh/MocA family protein [Amycolatopsis echigonensis]|nr:Gfo/Idh/MocA family oxidoreductase [Amycolatopsis echigonensis]